MNNLDINLTFVNSTFVNLENLDRDFSIIVGMFITAFSVSINVLAVALIITKSKKETRAYKTALAMSRVLLCVAQFQWGFLMCIVPLLPFPAFIFYGVLKNSVDVILLIQIWVVLIVSFLWSLYGTLVVRFRMVVRKNSFFDRYPKYKDVPKQNSLLIFADKKTMRFSIFSCIAISGGLITCYICLSVLIFLEVRRRVNSMSASVQKYHLKVLKDIIQQILIKLVTFIFYPFLTVCMYFVTPEFNTIILTMIIYNIFVAAPIPGTVVLILQTPSYRQFLIKSLASRVESF
ncbi:hypothetical protein CAEBREN_25161 [Caenorhabditis brenneri]|uniref:Uncharacterized protein n=1 Tax=Caenorhabditis brenneri TaxID=135651 RepID=G0N6L2_CAEBE|nr:hypothetical protein CAEBREN_25161 [Caenorhabditis brenneri]